MGEWVVQHAQFIEGIKRWLLPIQFCLQTVLLKFRWLATREINECGIEDGTKNSMLYNKWTILRVQERIGESNWVCKKKMVSFWLFSGRQVAGSMKWQIWRFSSVTLIDSLASVSELRAEQSLSERSFIAGICVCMMYSPHSSPCWPFTGVLFTLPSRCPQIW